jgi:ParB-like chromosome segregation protein Spo0J
MADFKPELVWRDPRELRDYKGNARRHSKAQLEELSSAFQELGFDVPIVVDGDGVIIKGHGRKAAAIMAGMESVPVIVRSDLPPDLVRAARIRDNKLGDLSDWDVDALALEMTSLEETGLDIGSTGFTLDELTDIKAMSVPASLDEIDQAGEQDQRPEKPAPEPDGTEDWDTLRFKVPPETWDVFWDLMHKTKGKPYQQLDALLGAVDVMALEDLARLGTRAR